MMRTLILNTADLRNALDAANKTARLSEVEWKALIGTRIVLEAAWIKQRRSALRAALADSRLPGPLRSLVRAEFEGKDFTDQELAAQIGAARESYAKDASAKVRAAAADEDRTD
jgi:hypothetical protein